jgi:hypothetical protein
MKNNPDKIILTVQQLRDEAQTSDLVEEETAEREQETRLKDARARRDEEWSLLANQVVGGETGIFPEARAVRHAGDSDAPASSDVVVPPSSCCGGASSS